LWLTVALVALFALALGARLIGLGGAVTEDEDQWIARSGTFAGGLATGNWQRTYLTGHPGVTVMWLTTLTLGVERTRLFERASNAPDVTTVLEFLPALERARLPFAVLQAGLVVLSAALVARLLGGAIALVAGGLLAAEPFWAGVGPVVGMDGPLTGFLTVSLLALLLACGMGAGQAAGPADRRTLWAAGGWAALSGALFGLAFLTKTTAVFVGPAVGALVLLAGWQAWRAARTPATGPTGEGAVDAGEAERRWWLLPLAIGGGWLLAASLLVCAVWPAMWLAPLTTLVRAISYSARLGGTPHAPGNFLLGQPVEEPGPLFYPVALLVRIGPATLLGLLLLFVFGAARPTRRVVWSLLGFAGLFLLLLTLAAKKVDRYLLPILPALGVLAAVGWYEGTARVARLRRAPAPALLTVVLVLAVQAWPLVQAGRYPLAAYNPLVGGVRTAEQAIPLGWGDGLDVAADRIRELSGGGVAGAAFAGRLLRGLCPCPAASPDAARAGQPPAGGDGDDRRCGVRADLSTALTGVWRSRLPSPCPCAGAGGLAARYAVVVASFVASSGGANCCWWSA
jgi:4-amino-4-deoxy-L-arabinose transferase-like glycosyltransferase